MRNKRGQFFLIAAIIIVGLIIGLATTVNSVRVGDENKAFFDQAEEVKYEGDRVFDYGVYKEEDTDLLIQEFIETYANYIAPEEFLAIYGNENDLTGLRFTNNDIGSVGINTGGIPTEITIQEIIGQIAEVTVDNEGKVIVEIDGIKYEFKLRKGENFFVLIRKNLNNEKFVATE